MLLICLVLLTITWICRVYSFVLWSGLSYFGVLAICLLLVYFVSATGCHCFDLTLKVVGGACLFNTAKKKFFHISQSSFASETAAFTSEKGISDRSRQNSSLSNLLKFLTFRILGLVLVVFLFINLVTYTASWSLIPHVITPYSKLASGLFVITWSIKVSVSVVVLVGSSISWAKLYVWRSYVKCFVELSGNSLRRLQLVSPIIIHSLFSESIRLMRVSTWSNISIGPSGLYKVTTVIDLLLEIFISTGSASISRTIIWFRHL